MAARPLEGQIDRRDGGASGAEDVDEAALDWFVRLRAAPQDAALREALMAWRAADPRHARAYERLERMWDDPAFGQAVARFAATKPARRRHHVRNWSMALAAALLVVVAVSWMLPDLLVRWQADYLTDTGRQAAVALPDGSTMTLNTASAVAIDFAGGARRVRLLRGEAFFEVVSDRTRPFLVAGRFGEVEVTGTAFSFRADADGDSVVLAEGSVAFRGPEGQPARHLSPGQAATATAAGVADPAAADLARLLAWRGGRLEVSSRPLGEVLDELQRYYPGRLVLLRPGAADLLVSGSYRLDSLDAAIATLAASAGLSVTDLAGAAKILL